MADATHLSLKVKLDEDIRRFSVQKDISFSDLHNLISKHFVLAPENVQIKYIDDEEELITLGSDLELQEAKRLQPTVLRLNVYDVKSKRRVTSDQPLPQLEALFVRDVTVPDGTSVSAKVKFQKVWRVKNTGSVTWPKGGVALKMVDPKDDQMRVLAVGTINRAVGPDEETDIGVELQAPSHSGRCVQYWRLFTEDGSAFGSRLWVDVNVAATEDKAAAEKELAEQEEARRLAEQEEQFKRLQLEEEEARRLAEQEEARRLAEQEEQLRQQAEEEMRKRQEEEAERLRREEQEAYERQMAELQRQLEEEDKRRREEEAEAAEQRRKQEEAAALAKKQEEEAAAALKRKQEEEAAAAAAAAAAEALRKKKQEEEEARKRQLYSKYPGQLTALAEMGFTNVEHNVKLLDKHKGSLDLALEALLSGH